MRQYNQIEYKKKLYPVNSELESYLEQYNRAIKLPISYNDLLNYSEAIPLISKGKNTCWKSIIYSPFETPRITQNLIKTYQLLNSGGCNIEHLNVASIDFCSFGNSQPFRIKIINEINDNYDYFYVKKTDASRIYGLELEDIFSPNKMNYLYHKGTLVEEHIIGIPGDQFISNQTKNPKKIDSVRLAKEFVKFNESCFVRLLGDMRSYNYVIVVKQDFDKVQYRIRAMDFDQQSYEGRKNIYLPQFFKDNLYFVKLAQKTMSTSTINQYIIEERSLLKKRIMILKSKYLNLIKILKKDQISIPKNIELLKGELFSFYKDPLFKNAKSMGEILHLNIKNKLGLNF